MTTTTVHGRAEEIAADYRRLAPTPPLHESIGWLRYCDRRSRGGMRYIAAWDDSGRMSGLMALRRTGDESEASTNYDVVAQVWPGGSPPLPRKDFYPQLFAATSGARCLFTAADARTRAALVRKAAALADTEDALLTIAYLPDENLAAETAASVGEQHALIGAETRLDVTWSDFDGYVASLRRQSRFNVRRERRQYLESGLRTRIHHTTASLGTRAAELHAQLMAKYGAGSTAESFLADFEDLAATVDEHVTVFEAERDGVLVGLCVCLRDGSTVHIRSVGFDYALAANDFIYFNLVFYEPITWGLDHGVTSFCLGNGAFPAKRRRGARLDPLYGVVRWPARVGDAGRAALVDREQRARADLGLPQLALIRRA
ncbi:GNAT family N-acetyltransferase [Kutzneria sp. NPDC052558]|uniref:GNAT family N-acetyltransferase n=1 Tax=Kutzneria sp. NPDC052558 TaxID=3364121 RepID=UPI0037CAACD8